MWGESLLSATSMTRSKYAHHRAAASAIPATSFGDGLRCAGGALKRLYSRSASLGTCSAPLPGDPSISARSAILGDPLSAGDVRVYQTQYRDPNPGFCPAPTGGTFNSSNALVVIWGP